MDNVFYLILGTFMIFTILCKLVLSSILTKGKYEKRLKRYITIEKVDKKNEVQDKQRSALISKASKAVESMINLSKNEQLLIQSGVKLSSGELFIGRVMTFILGLSVGYLYKIHFLLIIVFGIIGFYLPIMYIKKKWKQRLSMCSEQLGEALGMMANALRSGFSFMQAMQMVAEEVDDPLGPEFLKALQDIKYGVTVEDAFHRLLERLPDKELEMVLNTLIIQRTSGGNLAYLFETMQETIFDRKRVKDEVKTLTAQGKMSSVIITVLPLALALYIRLVNPEYFQMLFSHPLGWAMVIMGSFSILFGWLVIKKIVHIEV